MTPAIPLRSRLPKDPEERALRLADEIDDMDTSVGEKLGGLRAEIKELRAELQQIDRNVTARLRWVTLSLFSVTGIVFTAILTYVVAR